MFLTRPKSKPNHMSLLNVCNIPAVDDSPFELELYSWYNCDENTNSQLSEAMNYRKKIVDLSLDFITDQNLTYSCRLFFINCAAVTRSANFASQLRVTMAH
ncbi:unnamed protein product [Rotaria magnacalcarata]